MKSNIIALAAALFVAACGSPDAPDSRTQTLPASPESKEALGVATWRLQVEPNLSRLEAAAEDGTVLASVETVDGELVLEESEVSKTQLLLAALDSDLRSGGLNAGNASPTFISDCDWLWYMACFYCFPGIGTEDKCIYYMMEFINKCGQG